MMFPELNRISVLARHEELIELAAAAQTLRGTQGSRSAINHLLNGIGLRASSNYNETYLSEALDYHLALLYAHLNQPERASACIERIRLPPNTGGDQLFSDHVRGALERHQQMMEARERGIPSILIASMPRSASASLAQSLSATMNAPVLRMSAGHFPTYCVIQHWLNSLSPGGAVTHDHFGASSFNIKVLEDAGCRDIFVLVRDPRASAASFVNMMLAPYRESSSSDYIAHRIIEAALQSFYPWLADWMTAERTSRLRVHWLKSIDVRNDMGGTIAGILQNFRSLYPAVETYLDATKEVRANFVSGSDNAWRTVVSPAGQELLWQGLPEGVAELLELQP